MENNNSAARDMETEVKDLRGTRRKRKQLYKKRGEETLRTEHCSRLTRLLHSLVQQRNWKEASGVLSVLLMGSVRERFPKENRDKYLAAMELLRKMESDHIKPTSVKHIYELWIRKNGPMKKCPAKDKFSTQLELVLFWLTHGKIDEANQAMMSMMQETEYGSDPLLNMIAGLIYYELWYSCIPEEMKLKSSDMFHTSMLSELSGLGSYNPVESICCNSVIDQDVDSPAESDSTSSIGDNKSQHAESVSDIKREPSNEVFKPRGFYIEESVEMYGNKEPNHSQNLMATTIFKFRGLDASLLPLRLPKLNDNFWNCIDIYMGMLNDNYSKAVKHLQFALRASPPILPSLLPLVQLLLLGDQVEEAQKEIENICQTWNAPLPLRIRSILLECFDSKNSIMLSACYEDILKKDPTCSRSLTRLIAMHKNGDYGLVPLLEMIALHVDATYAAVWGELASCFLKLSYSDEDKLSVCGNSNEGGSDRFSTPINRTPIIFIHENSRKSWELRCRWWKKRHFSKNVHVLEMKAGDWELLISKAACASHLYGPEFWYVGSVYTCLEKEEKRDQILFLQLHLKNSLNVSEQLKYEEIILDSHSCASN